VAYSAEISRQNPGCFVFLVDQSGSMAEAIGHSGGESRPKAEVLSDAMNRLLAEATMRCSREDGIRDYFHVAVIGYGAQVGPALGGTLEGRALLPISQIGDNPVAVEEREKLVPDGAGGLVRHQVKFPVWLAPVANGKTPMCEAFRQAIRVVEEWVSTHPCSFPPVVLNITDGQSTDGDPSSLASSLTSLQTEDGQALLFNMHVSSDGGAQEAKFPDTSEGLADDYAVLLFGMSSILPSQMRESASELGLPTNTSSRGFIYEADPVAVVQFLEIGTRAGELR
jgi:hypothetical protein